MQSKLDKATGAAMVLWETGFAPADERAPNDVTIRLTLDLIAKPTLALTPITDLAVLVDMALRALAPEGSSGYNRDIAESLTAERTSVEGFPTYRFSFSLRTKANAPYIYDAALGPQDLTT